MNERPTVLHRAIEAAKGLRMSIAMLVAGEHASDRGEELSEADRQTIQDSFDGETTLESELESAIKQEDEDLILVEGIKRRQEELSARKSRIEKRMEARRGLIEQAMTLAGWPKLETPLCTLSLGKATPRVEVDEESSIPSQFWKRPEPVLSKTDLGKALRDHSKLVEAALKVRDPAARATAMEGLVGTLPHSARLAKQVLAAKALNEPEARADAFAAILRDTSPVPGCHLEAGGVSLTIRRK